jgi:hypothetical protein
MPRKTKHRKVTVADLTALWRLASADVQAKFLRSINKRHSQWEVIDALMPNYALLYDLYQERLGLPPTTFFKWLGALRGQNGKLLFGLSQDAAWHRLYAKYKAGNYNKRDIKTLVPRDWLEAGIDPEKFKLDPPPSPWRQKSSR